MDTRPSRFGLLGASYTTNNMGVWALASGAVASIMHAHPDARISFIDYASENAQFKVHHSQGPIVVPLINIRFSWKLWLPNNIARLLLLAIAMRIVPLYISRRLFHNQWFKRIEELDVVGSIAGGDSFSDIYGLRRLVYVTLPQILVLLMRKPLVLLPQTIGPFKRSVAKVVASFIFRRARVVCLRSGNRGDVLDTTLAKSKARVESSYDLGFFLEPKIETSRIPVWLSAFDLERPLVGLNISGLLHIGGYKGNNMFGLKVDYRQLVLSVIRHFVQEQGAHLVLVPHVIGRQNPESDTLACRQVLSEVERCFRTRIHVFEGDFDHHEVKALVGRCQFFIGSRMHACIAALSQGIPAVALAYSGKFNGVFGSVGMEAFVVDLRDHTGEEVLKELVAAFERRHRVQQELMQSMAVVRRSLTDLTNQLWELDNDGM